jgi:predicted nucleic acid-binding protein
MRVYVDTNVPMYAAGAGTVTPDIRRGSRALLRLGQRRLVELVASPLVFVEIDNTENKRYRRGAMQRMKTSQATKLPIEWEDDVGRLAAAYRREGVIGPAQTEDAEHLAWATLAEADVLCSWNRTHLVRLKTRHLVAIINARLGYRPIGVELPNEVLREIEEA